MHASDGTLCLIWGDPGVTIQGGHVGLEPIHRRSASSRKATILATASVVSHSAYKQARTCCTQKVAMLASATSTAVPVDHACTVVAPARDVAFSEQQTGSFFAFSPTSLRIVVSILEVRLSCGND